MISSLPGILSPGQSRSADRRSAANQSEVYPGYSRHHDQIFAYHLTCSKGYDPEQPRIIHTVTGIN